MPVLLFLDRGWEVATNAWTAAAKASNRNVTICYRWGADGISFFDSATGNSKTELAITMEEFTRRIAKHTNGGICDCRDVSCR